jgi:type II secretory pathway component GspD/PulD (secretin)
MNIKALITIFTLTVISAVGFGQIKIKSKGDDVRTVIDTIFEQAKMQYVLETTVRQSIYMSVDDVSFADAIDIVSNVADLTFTKRGNIWYVNKKQKAVTRTAAQPFVVPAKTLPLPTKSTPKKPIQPASEKKVEPKGKLDLTVRLTARLQKTDIREVFAEFAAQTKIAIDVDDSVPKYKIDAYMFNTSLKFAIERVCKAAGLKYEIVNGEKIRIRKA